MLTRRPRAAASACGAAMPDRGAAAVELAVLAPGLILLLLLVAAAGRVVEAQSHLDGAARDAARAATLSRSAAQGSLLAGQAAAADLGGGSWCAPGSVRAAVSGFPAPGPQTAGVSSVAVTVSCEVGMGPFAALGFPAHARFAAHAAAPIDPYTCRDGPC